MRVGNFSGVLGQTSAAAAFVAALIVCPGSAPAAQYKLLHAFCQQGSCQDGRNPQDSLIRDSDGNFYGAANAGGTNDHGAVFELTFNSSTQQYDYQILYSFCALAGCADGAFPDSPLIMDTDGNLYGTATQGGAAGVGIIYKLVKSEGYALHVLHNFCATSGCQNGSIPESGLSYEGQQTGALYDGISPLYGTTLRTDARGDGSGVAYELKSRGGFIYRLLHSFCLTDCNDGQFPSSLTFDSHGRLYGVAENGGATGGGVLFKLLPIKRQLKVFYHFCSQAACADGGQPDLRQALVRDSAGNIYGTTFGGGTQGMGTVWKFQPHKRKLSVLYNFCSQANCADGAFPRAGVTLGPGGELFGATPSGGSCNVGGGCGVVFELKDSTYTLLHSFCADGDPCAADGDGPLGTLLLDPSGTLFGTTEFGGGGAGGIIRGGTAFNVTP
jgi:uncharacterized repeat protein (TIGR03803 family)